MVMVAGGASANLLLVVRGEWCAQHGVAETNSHNCYG